MSDVFFYIETHFQCMQTKMHKLWTIHQIHANKYINIMT